MLETTWLPDVAQRPRHVAVGEFDGVHLGHRDVIAGADTVLTFEPHPRAVLRPPAPPLLTTLAAKAELLAGLGVRELVVVPFDAAFARRSADDFVSEILVGALGATQVAVGENFRFGWRAAGDPTRLRAETRFATRVTPLVELDGEVVSSTRIRERVAAGELERANRMLGAPFALRGAVAHGDRRGRTLGYPTANLVPDPALVCPANGVYACRAAVELDGGWQTRPAATSVGVRPTFGKGLRPLVEAHLLGFDGDLYGRELRVEFLSRLRGEERFDSVDALVEQMRADVEDARRIAA